jgi:hypothetical protein
MAVKKWVAGVKTVSTYPEEGLFTKDAETIAKHLASKKVSPKGPASGMRMLNYFINRGGKGLSKERHAELEKAKHILSDIIAKEKAKQAPRKLPAKKSATKSASVSSARKIPARKSATKS